MKNSKKKTPQSKLQRIKSNENISRNKPIGSLLTEINNLKQQLKDIKRLKKDDHALKTLTSPKSKISNEDQQEVKRFFLKGDLISKENKFNKSEQQIICYTQKQSENQLQIQNKAGLSQTKNRIVTLSTKQQKQVQYSNKLNIDTTYRIPVNLMQIYYKQKDKKLKADIQINKLKKIIYKIGAQELIQPLNTIFQLVTNSNQDFIQKIQLLQKTQVTEDEIIEIQLEKQQHLQVKQKLFLIEQSNKTLRQQLSELSLKYLSVNEENSSRQKQMICLKNKICEFQKVVKHLQQVNIELQQKNRIYQNKINQKQEQLIFSLEEVNYLRLQAQNFKLKKKELQQLYNQLQNEFKDYKKSKTVEFELLQIQKSKFEKQCKLRRSQSEQIQAFQSHRNALTKQIQQLRILYDVKSQQCQIKTKQLHQLRKKNIILQADYYKIKSENQKLKNQKQFFQFEVDQLNCELKQLKQVKLYKNRINRSVSKQIKHQINISQVAKNTKMIQKTSNLQKQRKEKKSKNQRNCSIPLEERENKLKALDEIHLLIKKHKDEIQI